MKITYIKHVLKLFPKYMKITYIKHVLKLYTLCVTCVLNVLSVLTAFKMFVYKN